jgi:hypothetical protein
MLSAEAATGDGALLRIELSVRVMAKDGGYWVMPGEK